MYEVEIKKLENYLKVEKDEYNIIKAKDVLRYYYSENETEKEKVIYNAEEDRLEYSKSIALSKEIADNGAKVIKLVADDKKQEVTKIVQNNYYYLARYLFSYFLVAIEFGIEPEKQFLAPRTSVLIPIARKLEKFYYKPKGVMTVSMPQRNRKNGAFEEIYEFCCGKKSRTAIDDGKLFCCDSQR